MTKGRAECEGSPSCLLSASGAQSSHHPSATAGRPQGCWAVSLRNQESSVSDPSSAGRHPSVQGDWPLPQGGGRSWDREQDTWPAAITRPAVPPELSLPPPPCNLPLLWSPSQGRGSSRALQQPCSKRCVPFSDLLPVAPLPEGGLYPEKTLNSGSSETTMQTCSPGPTAAPAFRANPARASCCSR